MNSNIAILSSGSGSNAEAVIQYFQNHKTITVSCLAANKPKAYALERAKKHNISSFTFDREAFYKRNKVVDELKDYKVDFIVLAGFLWLIPKSLLVAFPNRIINIHPSLLPKYGGKGMYGMNVHKAVFANNNLESGITIHLVNEDYDKGEILFQERVNVASCKSAEEIATAVLKLEHKHFAPTIERYIYDYISRSTNR